MSNCDKQITLVIKAANLKNSDFRFDCDSNWSVKRLKLYLSENYPAKPNEKYIRLIYFGKLLDDNLEIKDFIRNNSEITTHNIHIVYKQFHNDTATSEIETSNTQQSKIQSYSECESNNHENGPNQIQNENESRRQGYVDAKDEYQRIYETLKNYYESNGIQLTNSWNSTYLQHTALYYHMYENFIKSLGLNQSSSINSIANGNTVQETTETQEQNDANQAQPVPPPQQQQQQQAAQNEFDLRDEREDDWLSLLHNFCSFMVLFSIIYFYSSFTRFILVFAVVILLFLYHSGWFTLERRRIRNENRQQPQEQNDGNNQQPRDDNNQQNNQIDPQTPIQTPTPIRQQMQQTVQNDSALRLMARFIFTFFTSLVPDRPGRVPN